MKIKRVILIGIGVGIIFAALSFSNSGEKDEDGEVFHVTLADPNQYYEGIYEEAFLIDSGNYQFEFVPNGDSPQVLSIILEGENFQFLEDFKLKGILHETGISEYYTWEYEGENQFSVYDNQELKITINPNGNVKGPISIDITKRD